MEIKITFDSDSWIIVGATQNELKHIVKWFSKRKVVSFNDQIVVDFSKVKLMKVLEVQADEQFKSF